MDGIKAIYITFIVIGYAVVIIIFLLWMKKRKEVREKQDSQFVKNLVEAIQNGSLRELNDVKDMFCGFYKIKRTEEIEPTRTGLFLRMVKHSIAVDLRDIAGHRPKLLDAVNSLIKENNKLMEEEKRRLPFSGVPSDERSLLEDILELSGSEDKAYIREKLEKLASAIRIRQQTINQLSDEKGRSLRWAKWGVIGTVFFSLISIGLAISKL